MTSEPQLFRVNPENRETDRIEEVDFGLLGIRERRDIQEWVAANPSILGENLMVITKEFSGFDRTNERLDLLAVDEDGKLVVIELKRDDSGTDVHWQAIKYASYFDHTEADAIVSMLARHEKITQDDARDRLVEHLGADDLNALNNDQRIILASHRFAPEVTSAVLWLNQKAPGENLITCVKLTPHRDSNTNSLYVQASTIIPVPGVDNFVITVGDSVEQRPARRASSLGAKLSATFARNKNDEVTRFLRYVGDLAILHLPEGIRPDKISRWAGATADFRYYHLWYRRPPWGNWNLSYRINLYPQGNEAYSAEVEIAHLSAELETRVSTLRLHAEQQVGSGAVKVGMGAEALSDDFAERTALMTRKLIEQITPIVNSLEDEANEEDA